MAKLRDVITYLCKTYPHKNELTKGRLTKMVYLADWQSALDHGHQITTIDWEFNHYGPFVHDVYDMAKGDGTFEITPETNAFGSRIEIIGLSDNAAVQANLSAEEKRTLDVVINEVKPMSWNAFISHVYSTYPIESQPRYSHLDLEELAEEVRQKPRKRRA